MSGADTLRAIRDTMTIGTVPPGESSDIRIAVYCAAQGAQDATTRDILDGAIKLLEAMP